MKRIGIELDIETHLNRLEILQKGIDFLAAALPEYPHANADLVSVPLDCIAKDMKKEIEAINKKVGLV